MASAGDAAIAGAEAAAKKNRRRISDYLDDSDGCEAASPPTPGTRLRFPRFTCATLRFGGRKGGGRKGVPAAGNREDTSVNSSGWKQGESGGSGSATAETAGMGLSMLFLLARTCVELNRMAEVRAQMETLLKEIRDEASKRKQVEARAAVAPGGCELDPSPVASSSCTSDTNTNCLAAVVRRGDRESKPSEGERPARTDVPEAEVEAEPALLASSCDTADQETPESSSDSEFIELEGGRFVVGDCRGEEDDSRDGSRERGEEGVSAIELERRLHELLHRRNRERIEELESALRRAERKAREKEMEARLWQDTAGLALGQPPRDEQ